MADSVAVDMVAHIDTNGEGTRAVNTFAGPIRPIGANIPGRAVFVATKATGESPIHGFDADGDGLPKTLMVPLQVLVRWDTYEQGERKARAIFDLFDFANISGYLNIQMDQAEPIWLGTDDNNFHQFSINMTAYQHRTTAEAAGYLKVNVGKVNVNTVKG